MFEETKKTNEPEDIFAEARSEEPVIKPPERIEPTIPREFIREKRGFPKILIPIIILLILIGAGFFLVSSGAGFFLVSSGFVKLERKNQLPINQPTVTSPEPTTSQPANLDTDNDGLTDEEERNFGTNPNLVDTDNDGLTDKEETKIYQTDPLNSDTDSDGYKDGEEVLNGYHPKDPTPGAKLFDLIREIEKLQ